MISLIIPVDYAYDFDLTVSEGDVISMTVTATSESKSL